VGEARRHRRLAIRHVDLELGASRQYVALDGYIVVERWIHDTQRNRGTCNIFDKVLRHVARRRILRHRCPDLVQSLSADRQPDDVVYAANAKWYTTRSEHRG